MISYRKSFLFPRQFKPGDIVERNNINYIIGLKSGENYFLATVEWAEPFFEVAFAETGDKLAKDYKFVKKTSPKYPIGHEFAWKDCYVFVYGYSFFNKQLLYLIRRKEYNYLDHPLSYHYAWYGDEMKKQMEKWK